jgi:hypothetical protein
VAVSLAVVALAIFGLVGTIGLSGAWLYLAAGAGLLALVLLILEPEQLRTAQPLRRLESHAVSTTVEQTHSPSREDHRTGERSLPINPPSDSSEAESARPSPDRHKHLAHST